MKTLKRLTPRISAPAKNSVPAAQVAQAMLNLYGEHLQKQAICLTTPVPQLVPLSTLELSQKLKAFLQKYEPGISETGLYAHQAAVAQKLNGATPPNIVMTTATGSGKSLAFWAWAFKIMEQNPKATVVATFPTQALLWGQAQRLARFLSPIALSSLTT